jgi:hypothetical protein
LRSQRPAKMQQRMAPRLYLLNSHPSSLVAMCVSVHLTGCNVCIG